jgi:hypothetical protein
MAEASELDQLLNALSFSNYNAEYRPLHLKNSTLTRSVTGRKRLLPDDPGRNIGVLDGLALLLVDRASSDVAAVGFRRTRGRVEILYTIAPNDAIERRAVVADELIAIANGIVSAEPPVNPHHFCDALMGVVLRHCQQKLERRRDKLAIAWRDLNSPEPFCIDVPPADAVADFASFAPDVPPHLTPTGWEAWLRGWFGETVAQPFFASGDVAASPPTTRTTKAVLWTASILCSKQELSVSKMLWNRKVACLDHCLRKLGQYAGATMKIFYAAEAERRYGKGSIRFVGVPVSPAVTLHSFHSLLVPGPATPPFPS